jgi:hypothetical protein
MEVIVTSEKRAFRLEDIPAPVRKVRRSHLNTSVYGMKKQCGRAASMTDVKV